MMLILVLCGFGVYRLIVHARWLSLEQEMQSLAVALEDRIEPALLTPGQVEANAQRLLPDLCILGRPCPSEGERDRPPSSQWEVLEQSQKKDYCIRLLDVAHRPIALLQFPPDNPVCHHPQFWQNLKGQEDDYYHQIFYPLHTESRQNWGKLQIARSLNDIDIYLLWVELALVAILSLALILVAVASWWLSGLAMRPISRSYQQMQQFTADAAHELRTPMAALRAMVQTALCSDALSLQEAKETLSIINRQSYRLSKLVQDLLILCQMDQPQKRPSFRALLNESMNSCICLSSNAPLNPPSLGDFEGLEVPQFGGFRGPIHTTIQQRLF
jgi:two-component system OmpR family sensor kinase